MQIQVYQIFIVLFVYVVYKVFMEIKGYKEDRAKERLRDMVDESMKRQVKVKNLYD